MPQPTLAPNGIIGVLVPWGNTTTQLEIAPFTPTGVINAVGRFNFGPGIDLEAELRDVAEKLTYAEPSAMLLSLSPEMFEGGIGRARAHQELIAETSGLPAFTTTDGTFHELRRLGVSSVGLIAPAPQERMEQVVANFAAEGITVVRAHGMNCGLPNIKATPLDEIAAAFRAVDDTAVEAFIQIGTGLPAFAVAEQLQAELGRPVITSGAAGYRQTLEALGIDPAVG
jgi:maleate isomerase